MDTQEQSWARWSELRIGDARAQYNFWETLAKRQGWTVAFAETVFWEYRKFLHLTLTAPHPVTPPAPIKAAWDLHRELAAWRELPEAGEIERRLRGSEFANPAAVDQTRHLYALTFGRYPPESVWPTRAKTLKRRRKPSAMVWALAALGVALVVWLPEPWGTLAGALAGIGSWLLHRIEQPRIELDRLSAAVRSAHQGNTDH